jgi:hypothetical protein
MTVYNHILCKHRLWYEFVKAHEYKTSESAERKPPSVQAEVDESTKLRPIIEQSDEDEDFPFDSQANSSDHISESTLASAYRIWTIPEVKQFNSGLDEFKRVHGQASWSRAACVEWIKAHWCPNVPTDELDFRLQMLQGIESGQEQKFKWCKSHTAKLRSAYSTYCAAAIPDERRSMPGLVSWVREHYLPNAGVGQIRNRLGSLGLVVRVKKHGRMDQLAHAVALG